MTTQHYKQYGETVHQMRLHQRLPVTFIEKPGYHKVYVTLTAPLGAVHRNLLDAKQHRVEVPAGVAHFLEHKVFEQKGEDISRQFALHEAQVNAYTEHHRTTYLFSATDYVLENTRLLLEMFFHPTFTAEGVEKEKNIILEELNMHLDDPLYLQYYGLLKQLFYDHPVADDILGNKDSIRAISYETLTQIHAAYYQPELCHLTLVGDPKHLAILPELEKHVVLPKPSKLQVSSLPEEAKAHVAKAHSTLMADVLTPSVLFGIKFLNNVNQDAATRLHKQIATTLFFDLVFGPSSHLYEHWLHEGLINDAYDHETIFEPSYGYALIFAETSKPEAFLHTLQDTFKTLHKGNYISESDFKRVKKQMVGSFVMSLDALEYLAHESARLALQDISIYDVLSIAQTVSLADVQQIAAEIEARPVTSVTLMPNAST